MCRSHASGTLVCMRRMRPLVAAMAAMAAMAGVAAMAATGASSAAAVPSAHATVTSIDGTLPTPDGRDRTYHVYVPAGLEPGAPVPLLVALHGGTGWGTQFERSSGLDELADRHGFVVVYPDGVGVGRNQSALRTWNGGSCYGPAARQDVDDVAFVRLLVV